MQKRVGLSTEIEIMLTSEQGLGSTYLTVQAIQHFWKMTLPLLPKHIYVLREEDITHPKDLALFSSIKLDSRILSVQGKSALPGLAQIRLKQACDFFQFILNTGRTMKDQYLTYKSHVV